MNTDKTLTQKFIERNDYPIWYYKELEPVDVDYVIMYLLTTSFVVDIKGSKHEITFGKNRKHEIGTSIRYDDIQNSSLTSYNVIEKGFRIGKWYIISDKDTTDEFKAEYNKRKEEHEKQEAEDFERGILSNFIRECKNLDKEQEQALVETLKSLSSEELNKMYKKLMSKFNKNDKKEDE